MWDLLRLIFTPGDFEPHRLHFYSAPELMWFIILGNALVALAYILIPIALVYFVRKRKDLVFHWIFLFFGAFIFFCALTHVMHILIFFYPVYWLQGIVDATTGFVSIGTFISMIPILPLALKLPSPKQLEVVNSKLSLANKQLARLNKEEANKLAAIVNSSEDAIISGTLEGIITSWNKGAERIYGYKASEVIGKNTSIIVPKEREDEIPNILKKLKRGEYIDQYETERVTKDGRRITVSTTFSPIYGYKKKIIGVSLITRDITEQKQTERRKDEFLSMAAHELRTPTASLKGYTQVLQSRFAKLGDKNTADYLAKMDSQVERMTRLMSDLLDVSRFQLGKLEFKKEQFIIDDLIYEVIEDIKPLSNNHKIMFKSNSKVKVLADKDRISQVVLNFLTNAIKYSPENSKVVVSTQQSNGKIQISVTDSGIGIAKPNQKRIFDKFFRVDGTEEKNYPGMGMGLYIASEIVKVHGGSIGVKSVKGKGSTFYFSLPKKES